MNSEEKLQLFNKAREYVQYKDDEGIIQELIDKGLEINRKDEYNYSLGERALFGPINYSALYALWKAGAVPQSEYVGEFFDQFALGKTAAELYAAEEEALKKKKAKDITKNFSAQKLKLDTASFEFPDECKDHENPEWELNLVLKPFRFDNYFTETKLTFLGICTVEMKDQVFSKEGYTFKEEEIEPSSVYIQDVHNPIDLKWLSIKEGRKFYSLSARLYFDFEYEATDFSNEEVLWEIKIEK